VTAVPFVESRIEGGVATVTLQRPEVLNAISGAMASEIADVVRSATADPAVRVVVVAAAGERAFCVGADLKERGRLDRDGWLDNRERILALFAAVRESPVPTIASVFGYALGGGFELALSCDLVVAADDAVFGLPETTVGLVPGGGGTQLLARRCGVARAKELIFTGRRLPVEEALEWGVANRVVPREELAEATAELAAGILRASPVAVREAKAAIDGGFGSPLRDGIEIEDGAWRAALDSADRAEGIAAFNEKREPRWTNR
jgi:enoyl-CoA hydratase/carnithine racemase